MPDPQRQWGDEEGEAPAPPAKPVIRDNLKNDASVMGCLRNLFVALAILAVILGVIFAGCTLYLTHGLK